MYGDRRRYRRYNIDIKTSFTIVSSSNITSKATIENLSLAGAKLSINDRVKRGVQLFVEIVHDGLKCNIVAIGKIIWVKEEDNVTSCGIRFIWLSDKDIFIQYLKRLEYAANVY